MGLACAAWLGYVSLVGVHLSIVPLIATWLACSSPPVLEGVSPESLTPGDRFTVSGAELDGVTRVALVLGGEAVEVELLSSSDVALSAEVPAGLEEGRYDVRVEQGELVLTLGAALTVTNPVVAVPCRGDSTANTEVSLARGVVVVDRFYANGHRDTRRIPLSQVRGLKLQRRPEGGCAAIMLDTQDGLVLYADEPSVDLEPRARRMAAAMNKPLELVDGA